jgi:quercetin dioxygenase-like cupin family protein
MLYHRRIAAVTAVSLMAAGIAVIPALATPGSGFAPSPLALGHFGTMDIKATKDGKWDLFLKTKDLTDIGVDRLSVTPGGYSGWHSHAGPTFVTVTSGEITWYDGADCSWRVYHTGDSFVEGAQRPHFVANRGDVGATFVAVQIRPTGTAGRVDESAPENCSI